MRQDIHKGLAALRIHTNCACCLKEYEPEELDVITSSYSILIMIHICIL